MTAIKHPVLLWGLPVAALIIIFWLSLFCYSAIPVSGADATRALLPGHTPTLPEALVQNLRLPRSLVAVLIGASLALAGTLLQTLTHNQWPLLHCSALTAARRWLWRLPAR